METRKVVGHTIVLQKNKQKTDYIFFVNGIMEVHLLPGWKTLNINCYDGLSKPDKHVDAFII